MGLVAKMLVALSLVAAGGYLLQANDAGPLPRQASVTAPRVIVQQADSTRREYFVTRHVDEYIPLGARSITLPILMYHYIRPAPSMRTDMLGYRLSVTPENFQQQMDWLYANGYHAVNFNDVRAYFAGTKALPSRPFVITLDDGYADLYTAAFPILRAHRFTAVAYIVTGFVGQSRYVSADQVVEMDRAAIQIASHTVNHADLARMSTPSAMYELVQSKRWLEQLLGHPVVDFAYPSGKISSNAIACVRQAGYDTAVTEMVSVTHSQADRYTWTRIRVGGGEQLPEFIANLGGAMGTSSATSVELHVP